MRDEVFFEEVRVRVEIVKGIFVVVGVDWEKCGPLVAFVLLIKYFDFYCFIKGPCLWVSEVAIMKFTANRRVGPTEDVYPVREYSEGNFAA